MTILAVKNVWFSYNAGTKKKFPRPQGSMGLPELRR